jgi:hypothetical protein
MFGGALNLRSNAGGVNGNVVFGNPTTNGINLQILGSAAVDVEPDRCGQRATHCRWAA